MSRLTILVVIPTADLGRTLARDLQHQLAKFDARVDSAVSYEEAISKFSGITTFDLLVTHRDLPRNADHAVLNDEYLGIKLIKDWHAIRKSPLPAIIVAPPPISPWLASLLEDTGQIRLIPEALNLYDDIARKVIDLISSDVTGEYLQVVIEIKLHENIGTYRITNEVRGKNWSGELDVDVDFLRRLADKSQRFTKNPGWQQDMRDIGLDLGKKLFTDNSKFWGDFGRGLGGIEGDWKRTKLWFRVSPEIHSIVLESITFDEIPVFWMLLAPIYRGIPEYQSWGTSLFSCRSPRSLNPISCLLIEADTSGPTRGLKVAAGEPLALGPLKTAHQECAAIHDFLKANKDEFGIGRLVHFTKTEAGHDRPFWEVLRDLLDNQKWDIVHYAGHSFYDQLDKDKKGYLFFPPHVEGELPVHLDVSTFAVHLRQTGLLYLSSCQSSSEVFLVEVAKSGIPATIGFRWPVEDKYAPEYATEFYSRLFGQRDRCLVHAFQRARTEIHDKYGDKQIWAAPVLMLQPDRT